MKCPGAAASWPTRNSTVPTSNFSDGDVSTAEKSLIR